MPSPSDDMFPTRHIYIAGTGRAGTSFLVKYLTELGMDTSLSRRGPEAGWDDHSHAGLEEWPSKLYGVDVPYVVKSPWLYMMIDELLVKAKDRIDGLIIPVRDLTQAAASRVAVEKAARDRIDGSWMNELEKPWDVRATTPGGVIYSLDPADQARILAVGFHQLIQKCVAAELTIEFLAFPRITQDEAYLFSKLRRFLPGEITKEDSKRAFAAVADTNLVHTFAPS